MPASLTESVERAIHLDVPPERAFAFWLDPALLVRWMGDRAEIDARPGGRWRLEYGDRHVAAGEVVEVDPPRRLVLTWGWEKGDPGSIGVGESRLTVELEPEGGGTRLRVIHELPAAEVRGHAEGWDYFLPRLADAARPAMGPPVAGGEARAVADTPRGTAIATVFVAAPPQRTFRALASPEIPRWWVRPGVFDTRAWSGEVRPGGAWIASGVGGGGPYRLEGEFVEVEVPRRLVHTWRLTGTPGGPTTVTYELESIAGGTWLTLRHEGFLTRDAAVNTAIGWETSFRSLAELLDAERVAETDGAARPDGPEEGTR